nr:SRPBCC family protein [Streptomyces sp. SID3343]
MIQAPPARVWEVLSDPRRYAEWVVGTRTVKQADDEWPRVGARLRYVLGFGPVTFDDECVVRICEPERRLELEAMARPFGSARIAIELVPWGDDTVVVVDEHPLRGLGATLEGPPSELLLHLRNRRMLANLAREVGELERSRARAED